MDVKSCLNELCKSIKIKEERELIERIPDIKKLSCLLFHDSKCTVDVDHIHDGFLCDICKRWIVV